MTSTANPRPVRSVFTSRAGGVSVAPYDSFNLGDHVGDEPDAVAANRARLARVLGLRCTDVVWMEQIHSTTVTVVDREYLPADTRGATTVPATDALVTTTPGLALAVLVADCVPVLLSDYRAGVVAAVHAGRIGARNGIVARTVDTMVELGARVEHMHALLGPAASGERYEVPAGMAADVEAHLPGSRCVTAAGTPGLDIRAGIVRQLGGLGVRGVDVDPRCTISDTEFFSYRRARGATGRQTGLIWLNPDYYTPPRT